MSSPRIDGVSRRENVFGRVFVAVVFVATFRASPFANVQRQPFEHKTAVVAPFAGREEPVHRLQLFAIPRTLVFEHPAKGSETSIANGPREISVRHHATHVQVFDADCVELADQTSRHLIEVILAGIGDSGMDSGNSDALANPTSASLFATGQNPLGFGEFCLLRGLVLRVWNALAVGKRGESIDSEVNPDRRSGFWKLVHRFIEAERREVLPITGFGYRNRAGLTRKIPRPSNVQTPKPGELEVPIDRIPPEGGAGVFSGLLVSLAFEFWVSGPLLEEVSESRLKMSQGLLKRYAAYFPEKSKVLVLLPFREGRRRLDVVDLGFSIQKGVRTKLERLIVDESDVPKDFREVSPLALRRVKSEGHSALHTRQCNRVRKSRQGGMRPERLGLHIKNIQ
jgi:hypothetical protein